EIILGRMHSRTRTYIRQAARRGLRAETAAGVAFADEFHLQLTDVFARQRLVPTYGVERVRKLIQALENTGQLLLLRVSAADGTSLATAVVVGRNRMAVLWGTASLRANTKFHPNELLHWEAMRF